MALPTVVNVSFFLRILQNVSSASPAIYELMQRLESLEAGKRKSGGAELSSIDVVKVEGLSFAYEGDLDVLHAS